MKKIVLTGGGTAGHVTPNLALIPSLRERGYDIQYIGSYQGIEKKLIENAGIPYHGISSGKRDGSCPWHSGLSAEKGTGTGISGRIKKAESGCHRGGGLRADSAQVHPGDPQVRLRQHPRLPSAQIPGSCPHPVGGDRRGEGVRRHHHVHGRGHGHRRHALKSRNACGGGGDLRLR